MCMMLEVNIAFRRLYMGDVVNKTCIIARPLLANIQKFFIKYIVLVVSRVVKNLSYL